MEKIKKIIRQSFLYRPAKKIQNLMAKFKMLRRIRETEKEGIAPMPNGVIFEPTTKCNLNCQMCYQKAERALGKRDLSLEEIKKLLKRLADSGVKFVSMIGAEVFVRPDIFEIIDYIGSLKMKTYLATNGTLISEQNIGKLIAQKNVITGIGYSLDGLKDDHNRVRGREYAYDNLVKAIELTRDHFNLTVNTVVMEENLEQLPAIGRLVKSWGVNNYSLQFEMFATPEEYRQSSKVLAVAPADLAVEVKASQDFNFSLEKLESVLSELRQINGLNILIQPEAFNRYPEFYLAGNLREKVGLFCKDINAMRINAQGEIIFCPFIKKSFGDLNLENPAKLWNGQGLRELRKKLLQNNLAPICKRCCRLGVKR